MHFRTKKKEKKEDTQQKTIQESGTAVQKHYQF
jgi:hypothetical protein